MKRQFTSAGLTNNSIRKALTDLLCKPIAQARAIWIPTAIDALRGGNGYAWQTPKENGDMG
jgi:dipeptidase E